MELELFVYGTLMFGEIRDLLLGREVGYENAVAENYDVYKIDYGSCQSEYPVIKQSDNSIVHGKLLKGISANELELVSFYEGAEYVLRDVEVKTASVVKQAKVYFPVNPYDIVYGEIWECSVFKEMYLEKYVNEIIPETLSEYGSKR